MFFAFKYFAGDIILSKEICIFAYSMVSPSDFSYRGDTLLYGCDVGDYVARGQDFKSGKKNEVH